MITDAGTTGYLPPGDHLDIPSGVTAYIATS